MRRCEPEGRSRCARIRLRTVAATVLLALVLAACGRSETTATPGAGVLTPDGPSDIRLYPGSRPIGSPTQTDETSTWSYVTERGDPLKILDWYDDHLVGWTVAVPPRSLGAGPQLAARGEWVKAGARLRISAELAPGVDDDRTVQYNLQLDT